MAAGWIRSSGSGPSATGRPGEVLSPLQGAGAKRLALLALVAPLLLFALPLAAALPLALWQGLDVSAWQRVQAEGLWLRALALSVSSAAVSTVIALGLTLLIVTHLHGSARWVRLTRALGPMLALPHAAFALGLALLLMPAGVLARLLAPLLGWTAPPDWSTVNDARGFALTLVLVLKELPFLLWNAVALLQRADVALALRGWLASGATLGYSSHAVWWRIAWPALAPRLAWPVVAVLAYGLTVVDVALIVGPASPPTLGVLAWQSLQDGDPARQAEGAAMALLLGLTLLLLLALAWGLLRLLLRAARHRAAGGQRPRLQGTRLVGSSLLHGAVAAYATVALLLLASSFTGVWSFPALLPQIWTSEAWTQVAASTGTVFNTAVLALAASICAVMLALLWFESTPTAWDRWATPLVLAPLVIPPLLLLAGLYQIALQLRLDGRPPYAFVALAPAWRHFDARYAQAALALGRRYGAFWWRVKLPLLAAPLAAAAAVAFAVSVAQYLPTQWLGAGRFATVTTEAVTLASGGQRHTAAAFAVLQALLPLLGFAAAAAVGRWQTLRMR
jgi:putative thiamine transport system permease protein